MARYNDNMLFFKYIYPTLFFLQKNDKVAGISNLGMSNTSKIWNSKSYK